ncbi:autism susceptibility gene 2 protein-like [Uloborus diversus]|uniref:autism susceptibility gene 2 protein-like n=1 Tax=Uloborus diversus TaxID=327109 RepID=UPI0024098854|nr:autism susceptibility gene 2 protein-like [Uloborus diversus]
MAFTVENEEKLEVVGGPEEIDPVASPSKKFWEICRKLIELFMLTYIFQAKLVDRWMNRIINNYTDCTKRLLDDKITLTVPDVTGCYVLYGIGLAVSSLTLAAEIYKTFADCIKKFFVDNELDGQNIAAEDAPQTPPKTSPFPVKSPQYLPLPNRPLQQPEPSAAVAAVTVTASAANPATVLASSHLGSSNPVSLPSSTSPAGGVPFPTSLLSQEFPVSPTASTTSASKTVSPVLGAKSYDSAVKPHRGSNSDVVHSLAFPICSSYSDYTVNYATSQYSNNKHSYHNPEHRDSSQRVQYQKLTQSSYYHNSQQPVLDKYSASKDSIPRTSSKEVIACDGYKTESFVDNRYENKSGVGNINYCVNQAYANEKVLEESSGYKVQSENNVYPNYGASNSVKQKQTQNLEPVKQVSPDHVPNLSSESSSSIQPPVTEGNNYHPPLVSKDKTTFYPYDTPHFVPHRTTPPLPASKSESSFDSLSFPSKEQDSLRYSSTTTAISQRPTTSSPITIFDNSKSSVKTLWSPSATTSVSVAPSRELIAASSRDSHSSHSNSSISSLSQLSQSLGPGVQGSAQSTKEYSREGRSSSRSSSRNETPVCCAAPVASTNSTSAVFSSSSGSYGVSGSLTSLIFSKPSWASPSVTSVLSNPGTSSHFAGPSRGSPVPSVLPLGPSLPGSAPFSPAAPPLHSAAHHVMFAPPLPPAGTLSSPLAAAQGPSPFGDQDLLRRELDTRFLASQDRSINVPPPPYLRAELHQHQHQHTHMHQHSPFLPPPMGSSLLPPSAAHLYDKFPKVDAGFYGRNALSLPTYPSLSPLLAPGSATATPTPFAPPGSLAAFQPKISPLVKAKTMKPGRWCAMHVRISWEIYHHQQKQQAESQKGGSTKSVTDLLRHPNHLFGSIPRPHELGFSSPLLGSAASLHGRSPYDVAPQHPSFLSPTPAHLGMTPFARPTYPGLGVPGNSFGGLGSLAGLTGAGMLTARDLGPGYLSMGQDPWSRLHRTPPNFPSPSAMNPSSWGGLKAEAERDRLQRREEQEREKEKDKQKKAEIEKREKEAEKSKEIARESKREHEKQKERDRENRNNHIANNNEAVRNGEMAERNRDREWERSRERRDSSRSPIRSTHKSEGAFDGNTSTHKSDIKVKEEKKEDEHNKESATAVSGCSERERTKPSETSTHQEPVCDYMSRGMLPGLPTGLSSSEQARLAGSLGAMSQVPPPHFWNPLPPPPPQSATSASERYRSLELQHARDLDREQLMQKYASLSSVMPLMPERYREVELARQLSSSEATAREIERQLQADRDRQAYERTKLPPPLRPNDSPFVPPAGLPPAGGLFSSLSNPFLNNLCGTNYPPRTKPGSPGGIGNGIPPPLIPCVSQGGSPVTTSTTPSPLHIKLASSSNSTAETTREHYASKERRDMTSHSSEVESQSR